MTSTLHDTAAEMSATAADLADALTDECACPMHLARARELVDALTEAIGGLPADPPAVDLQAIARRLDIQLRAHRRPGTTDASTLDVQALCVAEEAGELVGAYRRWAGKARRTGTLRELEAEVADVLIVTAMFAERAGIDLNAAITAKLAVIYTRGWREDDTRAAPQGGRS